MNKIYKTIWN
ncbi:hypothetical protein IAI17_44035, partial [Escherichia coli]|nr:hypothetical protein [Escherichia coli]